LSAIEPSDYAAAAAAVVALPIAMWLYRRGRDAAARGVWMAAIVAVSVPFRDLHAHTHWAKIGWIPFVTPPVKASDIAANLALYFPLGYFTSPHAPRRHTIALTLVVAAILALATELTQLYSHSRFPSSTDVVCDCLGAALGAWTRASVRQTFAAETASTSRPR
jgi:glycopeptide antibiotics resistance protein